METQCPCCGCEPCDCEHLYYWCPSCNMFTWDEDVCDVCGREATPPKEDE